MSEMLLPVAGILGQWAPSFCTTFWMTLRETAPYLVLGLILAGVLHVLVPVRIILWALGQKGWRGAIRGALVGVPLPLCSCGVLPTALTLRRQGASLSASTSFTISTPETSIDALAITAALLPAAYLGVRPLAALLLAVGVGVVVEMFSVGTREQLRLNVLRLSRSMDARNSTTPESACCEDQACSTAPADETRSLGVCRVCGQRETGAGCHEHSLPARLKAIFSYAFGTFFRDIAAWVLLGLGFAALIQVLVPASGLQSSWIGRHPGAQITLAILMGIPLYSCATATTPLVAVLLAKGLNPGAALALLLAGPATNIGNVFALKRELGGRVTLVYYLSLAVLCWLVAYAFHLSWPLFETYPRLSTVLRGWESGASSLMDLPPWLEIGCSWLLLALTLKIALQALYGRVRSQGNSHRGHAH